MDLSIVIPTYNEKERIGAVLDIICKHPLIDEIIVVDDGSTDNTASVLSNFSNIKILTHLKLPIDEVEANASRAPPELDFFDQTIEYF